MITGYLVEILHASTAPHRAFGQTKKFGGGYAVGRQEFCPRPLLYGECRLGLFRLLRSARGEVSQRLVVAPTCSAQDLPTRLSRLRHVGDVDYMSELWRGQ